MVPMMSDSQFRIDSNTGLTISAANESRSSNAVHARFEGLRPNELYSWSGMLERPGLLNSSPAESSVGFVRVVAPSLPLRVSLILPKPIVSTSIMIGPAQMEKVALVQGIQKLPWHLCRKPPLRITATSKSRPTTASRTKRPCMSY